MHIFKYYYVNVFVFLKAWERPVTNTTMTVKLFGYENHKTNVP